MVAILVFSFLTIIATSYGAGPRGIQGTQSRPVKKCSPGWTMDGSKCYKLFNEPNIPKKTWKESLEACEASGEDATLASINSLQEQTFIFNMVQFVHAGPTWFGLESTPAITPNEWRFTDGSQVTYSNWFPGQPPLAIPESKHFKYGYFHVDSRWILQDSEQRFSAYICQDVQVPLTPAEKKCFENKKCIVPLSECDENGACRCSYGFHPDRPRDFKRCLTPQEKCDSERKCTISNSVCQTDGSCGCQHGYQPDNIERMTVCISDIEKCRLDQRCSLPNSECALNGVCVCSANYYPDHPFHVTKCLNEKEYCQASDRCKMSNSACDTNGNCICISGSRPDQSEGFMKCIHGLTDHELELKERMVKAQERMASAQEKMAEIKKI